MVNFRNVTNFICVLCCLQITACTSVPKQEKKESVPVEERSISVEEKKTGIEAPIEDKLSTLPADHSLPDTYKTEEAIQSGSPAVVALLDDVKQYEDTGKPGQAVATLERALRIEPKNPLLWQRLSLLHFQQENWQQAITMAKKSNALAAGNKELQLMNWKIIARASEAKGDKAGVQQANQIIQSLN